MLHPTCPITQGVQFSIFTLFRETIVVEDEYSKSVQYDIDVTVGKLCKDFKIDANRSKVACGFKWNFLKNVELRLRFASNEHEAFREDQVVPNRCYVVVSKNTNEDVKGAEIAKSEYIDAVLKSNRQV